MKRGALPSQIIRELIKAKFIDGAKEGNINTTSLDLSISDEIYRVEGIFQPRPDERIRDLLETIEHLPHDLNYPLERGVIYLARLNERLSLPDDVYGYCNPKSSTGRNDVHVRLLADGVSRYDTAAPAGYKGELWLVINPKSYPIKIRSGERLIHMRFLNHDTRFDELELQIAFKLDKLLWRPLRNEPFNYEDLKIRDNDGSIILTLDLTQKMVGYRCAGSDKILDFSKINHYRPEDFYEPIQAQNGRIHLKRGQFYVLSTREAVRVPPYLASEMVPMDERSGEFRSHYAGFIDPGWGCGKEGGSHGRQITLELRPFEDLVVRDNQPIAKIRFERMIEISDMPYDELSTSNYRKQVGPTLSKHFRQ